MVQALLFKPQIRVSTHEHRDTWSIRYTSIHGHKDEGHMHTSSISHEENEEDEEEAHHVQLR